MELHRSVSKWHGRIMMGSEKPLQIPIVLPSLCFRGNSLLPSGRPSSLSSSHFPLMGFSSVLFPSNFLFLSAQFLFLFPLFSPIFSTLIWRCLLFSVSSSFFLILFTSSTVLLDPFICSQLFTFYPAVVIFISSLPLCVSHFFPLCTLKPFSSIHPLSTPFSCAGMLEPILTDIGQGRFTPWTGHLSVTGSHTKMNKLTQSHPVCMCLECWAVGVRTHAHAGRACRLQPEMIRGIEPRSPCWEVTVPTTATPFCPQLCS